jgi:trehalose 6-phosphate phosphatase
VAIPELIYGGNHGMEISGPGVSYIEPIARELSPRLHALGQEIAKKLQHIYGAFVEDKGLTLSIHYRRVAAIDDDEVSQTVRAAVTPLNDKFRITRGDKVFEIRPLTGWNKGTAITWVKQQLGKADTLIVYLGDDETDEDAFQVLSANAVTIRVGTRMQTAAQFVLPDPASVLEFLQWLNTLREDK